MSEATKPSPAIFQTFLSLFGTSRDKLENNANFRITSMSSIEVSLMASDYKRDGNVERVSPRPQRPPPPPPSQPPNEQAAKPPEPETPSPLQETPTDPIPDQDKPATTLLSEFQRLFDAFDYEFIRESILSRQMIECDFTTVLWRVFLHCLPRDSTQWTDMFETSRRNYEKLVDQYKIDPYKMSDDNHDTKNLNHPLSRDENSLWAQYFANEELKGTITIDVRRTWPDIAFFRDPRMIDLQLRILFIHTRHHHQTIPYRQGMHEILGIIVYAIHSETLKVNEYPEANELMKQLYDPQYLEHDAYAVFEKIMEHLRQFYALTKNHSVIRKPMSVNDPKQTPFQRLNDVQMPTNGTVARMNSIFERLRHYDRSLHCKLEEFSIEPTVYGIRWLRLLFGREVPFESIPNLWTVIFCYDEHFGFVDYFFIALLMQVGQIIDRQAEVGHTSYLQSLMKQNVITNVEPVIRKALNLTGRQLPLPPEEPAVSSSKKTSHSVENEREHSNRTKEVQRIPIPPASQPRLNRPHLTDARKSMSPPQADHQMNSIKRSASNYVAFPTSPPSESGISMESTMFSDADLDPWASKTVRQRYEDNVRLQKACAQYMNKFIERLQLQVCDMNMPNEDELLLQLSGLKQIANVLDGKLTFDGPTLQTLVDYKSERKSTETRRSGSDELS